MSTDPGPPVNALRREVEAAVYRQLRERGPARLAMADIWRRFEHCGVASRATVYRWMKAARDHWIRDGGGAKVCASGAGQRRELADCTDMQASTSTAVGVEAIVAALAEGFVRALLASPSRPQAARGGVTTTGSVPGQPPGAESSQQPRPGDAGTACRALARLTAARGSRSLTVAAKELGTGPTALIEFMRLHGWLYQSADGGDWIAYQQRLKDGLLAHRPVRVRGRTGTERIKTQVMVTPAGLVKLAYELGRGACGHAKQR